MKQKCEWKIKEFNFHALFKNSVMRPIQSSYCDTNQQVPKRKKFLNSSTAIILKPTYVFLINHLKVPSIYWSVLTKSLILLDQDKKTINNFFVYFGEEDILSS